MFGHKSLPTIVYSFGCKAPHAGLSVADDQLRLAHRYYNALIEIERDRRIRHRATQQQIDPGFGELVAGYEQMKQDCQQLAAHGKAACAASRSRKAFPLVTRQQLAELNKQKKMLAAEIKLRRAAIYGTPENGQVFAAIDAEAHSRKLQARADCGVHWGSYLPIEAAADAAGKSSVDLPTFKRWDGEGKVGTQIQKGISPSDLVTDNRVRVEYLPAIHPREQRQPHAIVSVRIGSNPDRSPIWCSVKARIHRPIPADCKITWVYIVRRRVANTDHWSVQFTLSRESGWGKPVASSGVVGVDPGWRVVPDGLRVATWQADAEQGELVIPADRLAAWRKIDDLDSIRDRNFNAAMHQLRLFGAAGHDLPDWFYKMTEHAGQWKSQGRLAVLLIYWRDHRFAGDDAIYDQCELWRKQDKHLWLWAAHQARSLQRWRLDSYRNFAAMLRGKARVLKIENTKWNKLARRPKVEESDDPIIKQVRHNQRIASVGLLLTVLRQSGMTVETVEAANTTRCCHVCGHTEAFDAIRELIRVCPNCGSVWDQDVNAARNIRGERDYTAVAS